jgi:hypothetical protein
MRALLFSTVAGLAALALLALSPADAQAHGGYFGNGGQDVVPPWHQTLTPFGPTYWYRMGPRTSSRTCTVKAGAAIEATR